MANPQVAYPITLHISGVHLRTECSGNCYNVVYVDAIMNGKKIELGAKRMLSSRSRAWSVSILATIRLAS